jgi:serine/threonine protein kinase
MSYEMLKGSKCGKPIDWWAVGVITYELILGQIPFTHKDHNKKLSTQRKNRMKSYEKPLKFPNKQQQKDNDMQISDDAQDFIRELLNID